MGIGLSMAIDLSSARGQETPPPPEYWLGVGFELELEFLDVEGKGGFANMDIGTLRADNRSAHVDLDKFVVAPVLGFRDLLTFMVEVRGDDGAAYIDRAFGRSKWFDLVETCRGNLQLRAELGKNHPFVRPERRTEAYPLIGTAFWKAREYHANVEMRFDGGELTAIVGTSVSQKRPLSIEEPGEDRSFSMLVLDDHDTVVGTNLAYGGKLGLGAYGANLLGFAFSGKLMDNHDTQFLDQNLFAYRMLGDRTDDTFYWYGGRFTFDRFGVHAIAEMIRAKDGLLPRNGWYVGLSYDAGPLLGLDWLPRLEPIFRYNELDVEDLVANPEESESWDRQMTVAGLLVGLTPISTFKLEYYLLDETTGGAQVKDNQLLVQLEFELDPVEVWRKGGQVHAH
jgi:hypothetical protein